MNSKPQVSPISAGLAPLHGGPSLDVNQFNQGEHYRGRIKYGTARLKHVTYCGLRLESILHHSLSGLISEDIPCSQSFISKGYSILKDILMTLKSKVLIKDIFRQYIPKLDTDSDITPLGQVWVILDSSRTTVQSQLKRIIGEADHATLTFEDSTWIRFRDIPTTIITYLNLFRKCFLPFYHRPIRSNHILASTSLSCIKLADSVSGFFDAYKPKAIFLYRDFTPTSNAILQIANKWGIPTYTTQHSVTPQFLEDNDRAGNVDFDNSFADYFIAWGQFTGHQRSQYYELNERATTVFVHERPTSPSEIQLDTDKSSTKPMAINHLIVSLMGLRQEEENIRLLELAFPVAHAKSIPLLIRPHPSLYIDKYRHLIDEFVAQYPIKVELDDSVKTIQSKYTNHSLGLTGLTSTYYENLFFGIPVLFYDHGIRLVTQLPRVLPGIKSLEQALSQIDRIEKLTISEWFGIADPICKSVYNLKCLNFAPRISMIDFINSHLANFQNRRSQPNAN